MKTAIIALTCGRINYTRQTFAHNFKEIDTDVFIWDNSERSLNFAHNTRK